MKRTMGALIVVTACVFSAAEVSALSGGGGGRQSRESASLDTTRASVPEPSTLYAVGAGLAFLGGAGWYIRRRK